VADRYERDRNTRKTYVYCFKPVFDRVSIIGIMPACMTFKINLSRKKMSYLASFLD